VRKKFDWEEIPTSNIDDLVEAVMKLSPDDVKKLLHILNVRNKKLAWFRAALSCSSFRATVNGRIDKALKDSYEKD